MAKSIAEHRASKGLTQVELARISGVHPVSLNRYERRHATPNMRTLSRIARALDVPVGEIDLGLGEVSRAS